MICWRTKLLQLPNISLFAILLSLATVLATVCNIIVIIIIVRMKKRSTSNHILLSLSVSDLLVGSILGPITITQVLDTQLLSNCTAHFIRGYILVLLVGSSLLTLAVVSYDRYLLLTKLSNYNRYMTKQKASLLIGFSWLFPGLIPIAKQFNMMAYVTLRIFNCTLPLVALGTFYFLITKEVRRREAEFSHHRENPHIFSNNIIPINDTSGKISMSPESGVVYLHDENSRNNKKHVRLAKSVTFLISCYFTCIFPLNVWMILELAKVEYSIFAHQVFYLSAVFLMQINSCINPIIYYLKQNDIKKGFRKIFKLSLSKPNIQKLV